PHRFRLSGDNWILRAGPLDWPLVSEPFGHDERLLRRGQSDSLVDGWNFPLHVELQRVFVHRLCTNRLHVWVGSCNAVLGRGSRLSRWRVVLRKAVAT